MDGISVLQNEWGMSEIDWIRKGLEKPGKTQLGLAKALGRAPSAITRLLAGDRDLKQREVAIIAEYLETDAPEQPKEGFRPPPRFLGDADLPVYSAAEGGPGTMVVSTDAIAHVVRPWYLGNVKDGYAVLVVGDSMEPVFEAGDMAVVNPRLAPMRNKNVILVSDQEGGEFTATIKRLLGWTDKEWKLRQFNPKRDFTLSRKDWPKALRVVGKYDGS